MQTNLSKEDQLEIDKEKVFEQKCPVPWWKRIGMLGFMFFLVKGLGWVALFTISWIWGPEALNEIKSFFTNLF